MKDIKNWDKYKNKLQQNILLTHIAYSEGITHEDLSPELFTDLADNLAIADPNLKVFFISDMAEGTGHSKASKYEHRCIVFVNSKTKEITFANAGTRLGMNAQGYYDVADDYNLYMHNPPKKLKSAEYINSVVLDVFGSEISEYKLHYTGHSLGAAMAELGAVDMALQMNKKGLSCKEKIDCITFDNPGTKPIVEKLCKNNNSSLQNIKQDVSFKTINNGKNFINTLNEQTGEVYEIKDKEPKSYFKYAMSFLAYVTNASSELISKVFSILSYGNISHQIDKHSLKNFDELFIGEKGIVDLSSGKEVTSEDILYSRVPIKYNKAIFEAIKQDNDNKGHKLSMHKRCADGSVESISFSKEELQHVCNMLNERAFFIAETKDIFAKSIKQR